MHFKMLENWCWNLSASLEPPPPYGSSDCPQHPLSCCAEGLQSTGLQHESCPDTLCGGVGSFPGPTCLSCLPRGPFQLGAAVPCGDSTLGPPREQQGPASGFLRSPGLLFAVSIPRLHGHSGSEPPSCDRSSILSPQAAWLFSSCVCQSHARLTKFQSVSGPWQKPSHPSSLIVSKLDDCLPASAVRVVQEGQSSLSSAQLPGKEPRTKSKGGTAMRTVPPAGDAQGRSQAACTAVTQMSA